MYVRARVDTRLTYFIGLIHKSQIINLGKIKYCGEYKYFSHLLVFLHSKHSFDAKSFENWIYNVA